MTFSTGVKEKRLGKDLGGDYSTAAQGLYGEGCSSAVHDFCRVPSCQVLSVYKCVYFVLMVCAGSDLDGSSGNRKDSSGQSDGR